MHKKLIARTAKLSSESKKSRKHQGVAIAYEHIPNDMDERGHGAIYALVNVNASAESAEEVAELIIDAFHGEYYQDIEKDPLSSFETSLSRVNEELADITHHGNIGWLGNLNAVLAVLVDDTLHISQAGKAEAFLYRGGKSSHISRDLAGDSINPLRTFINIASGDLAIGDKVALATPGVFFHVSKDELQHYVEEFQPKVAISHLADLLEGNSTEMQPNSIMVIEAITPEAASEETITEVDDEIWLSEQTKPIETVIEKSAPLAQKALFYSRKYWQVAASYLSGVVWPKIAELAGTAKEGATVAGKSLASRSSERISKLNAPKAKKELVEEETVTTVSEIPKEDLEDLTIHEHSNSYVPTDSGRVIRIKETDNRPKWLKLERIDLSYAKKLGNDLGKKLGTNNKNKKNLLFVAVAVLIVLCLGVFSAWRLREAAEDQKLAEASYSEAQNKLSIGKTDIANGDLTGASSVLDSALAIAKDLEKNSKLKDKATALAQEVQTALDAARGVVRVSPKLLGDANSMVGNDVLGPYLVDDNIFVVSKTNGTIAAISTKNGEVSNAVDKPNLSGGKFVAAAPVLARSVIVLFSDKGSMYEFDTVDYALTKQSTSGTVEIPSAAASFSSNIYTVESSTGKIYKRTKTTGGYSARSEYIKDGSTVVAANGIAIDSNIYTLAKNGNITKYLGGSKEEFANSLPFTVSAANQIFTNEDTNGIYTTEGSASRVIYRTSDGKFVHQYVSDQFKDASGSAVNDTAKTMYTLVKGKVYKISL